MNFHSKYKGCNIYKPIEPSDKLTYCAYVNNRFIYADTLTGIKRMITNELKGE